MATNSLKYMREYRAANRDRINERNRQWASDNRDRVYGYSIMRKYGLTTEQYDAMLKGQNNHCALCPAHVSEAKLVVDHDHATGQVRGLLCRSCNSSIGKLGDTAESLMKVVAYLKDISPLVSGLSPDEMASDGLSFDDVIRPVEPSEGVK